MSATSTLADPVTYGEDLPGNLQRVLKIAPSHCADCADYHIRSVAHRTTGERFGIDLDRPELVAVISDIVGRGLSRQSRLDIVIAGSADTGVLATVAHAVALLGDEALRRCRFTVLDLCPTPLLLCEHFADEHGLDFDYAAVDLTAPGRKFPADIVVMHSVFRFIDSRLQPAVLQELGSWLKPGGSIVFSNRIKSASSEESEADLATRGARNERFAAMTAQGEIDVAEGRAAIMVRLDRSVRDHEGRAGEFRTADDLKTMLENGPLPLVRFDEIVREIGGDGRPRFMRKRVLAVLRAPG
ncbi:class I SAM-dependent methyltransferase [Mesorhizobium loti]|uniref:Class I SAM-dependent methyltransferase n=1 Tax=Mesorhizobium loti R88b TaxID=935548 RepID=A0A6M7WP00_RHILI|nr:class I SAM-dependent methyltransferase [Mesorhizobium loti]QKD00811.1 class I SAM-dependent methyltransferase [Mesorhizobium loti R88b]